MMYCEIKVKALEDFLNMKLLISDIIPLLCPHNYTLLDLIMTDDTE